MTIKNNDIHVSYCADTEIFSIGRLTDNQPTELTRIKMHNDSWLEQNLLTGLGLALYRLLWCAEINHEDQKTIIRLCHDKTISSKMIKKFDHLIESLAFVDFDPDEYAAEHIICKTVGDTADLLNMTYQIVKTDLKPDWLSLSPENEKQTQISLGLNETFWFIAKENRINSPAESRDPFVFFDFENNTDPDSLCTDLFYNIHKIAKYKENIDWISNTTDKRLNSENLRTFCRRIFIGPTKFEISLQYARDNNKDFSSKIDYYSAITNLATMEDRDFAELLVKTSAYETIPIRIKDEQNGAAFLSYSDGILKRSHFILSGSNRQEECALLALLLVLISVVETMDEGGTVCLKLQKDFPFTPKEIGLLITDCVYKEDFDGNFIGELKYFISIVGEHFEIESFRLKFLPYTIQDDFILDNELKPLQPTMFLKNTDDLAYFLPSWVTPIPEPN